MVDRKWCGVNSDPNIFGNLHLIMNAYLSNMINKHTFLWFVNSSLSSPSVGSSKSSRFVHVNPDIFNKVHGYMKTRVVERIPKQGNSYFSRSLVKQLYIHVRV